MSFLNAFIEMVAKGARTTPDKLGVYVLLGILLFLSVRYAVRVIDRWATGDEQSMLDRQRAAQREADPEHYHEYGGMLR